MLKSYVALTGTRTTRRPEREDQNHEKTQHKLLNLRPAVGGAPKLKRREIREEEEEEEGRTIAFENAILLRIVRPTKL